MSRFGAPAQNYFAFGLVICSEIPLGESLCCANHLEATVVISIGAVPRALVAPEVKRGFYQATNDDFLLSVPNVARYLISRGSTIRVDPVANADSASVNLFLLETAFTILFRQRKTLFFQASAVESPHGALLFSGRSGVGKSALAAALYGRGHGFISDEICVVRFLEGAWYVAPSIPRILLWPDIIRSLHLEDCELQSVRPGLARRSLAVHQRVVRESLPVYAIYYLNASNCPDVGISWNAGIEKFQRLRRIAPAKLFERPTAEDTSGEFGALMSLAAGIRVADLVRPKGQATLNLLAELVLSDIKG